MPFDIGFGELIAIAVVALIVVGPKDLPNLFRNVGRFMGRMRAMADDFRRTMESAADDAGINDVKRDFEEARDEMQQLKLDEINESAKELEDEIKADLRETNNSQNTDTKAKAEDLRAKQEAIKAEARAEMLQKQAADAASEAHAKRAALDKAVEKSLKPASADTIAKPKPKSKTKPKKADNK